MFENPGSKIKIFAKILFWITIVAVVIAAFSLGWTESYSRYYSRSEREFHAEIFFPILIGGGISSYLTCLFLSAFGELVENSGDISSRTYKVEEAVRDLEKKMTASSSSKPSDSASSAPRVTWSDPRTRAGTGTTGKPTPVKKYKNCPACGAENPGSEFYCYQCGTRL